MKLGRLVQSSEPDKEVYKNFKEVILLCDRVGLIIKDVKDKACEVFRIILDAGLQKTVRLEYIQITSVLYSARIVGGPSNRTFKEMVLATDTPKKKIVHCMKGLKIIKNFFTKSYTKGSRTFRNIFFKELWRISKFAIRLDRIC